MTTSEDLRELGARFRAREQATVEHAEVLRRNALVWWQGGAAEEYRRRVAERSRSLDQLARDYAATARLVDTTAEIIDLAPESWPP